MYTERAMQFVNAAKRALGQMTDVQMRGEHNSGAGWTEQLRSEFVASERDFDSACQRASQEIGELFGPGPLDEGATRSERWRHRHAWWQEHNPDGGNFFISGGHRLPDDKPQLRYQGGGIPREPVYDNGPVSTGPFGSLGEQLRAIITADSPGQAADPRLFEVRAPSGMSEGIGADGGFAVQTDFSNRLLTRVVEKSKLASRCNTFPLTTSNRLVLPVNLETSRVTGSRFGGLRSYWAAEAGAYTSSKPTLGSLELKLDKLTALVYLTDEVLEDTAVLEEFTRQAVESEFGFVIDEVLFRGDGAGKPLGVLSAPCLVTVAKEAGQLAETITPANITSMWSRLLPGSIDNSIWITHQSAWPQLLQLALTFQNVAGNENVGGSAVGLMGGSMGAAPFTTLLGRPIVSLEQASELGTVGDIVLADYSRYLLAMRRMQTHSSMHVQFIYGEQVLRFTWRLAGQPELSAPITPYSGTDTQSAFIALETRD